MTVQDDLPINGAQDFDNQPDGATDENLQFNRQDMDQNQRVEQNPALTNLQNIYFSLPGTGSFCGEITGLAFSKKNRAAAEGAAVSLYFGNDSGTPVGTVRCDNGGRFLFNELPPGFYTLSVAYGAGHIHRTGYIKVLPGRTVHQEIELADCYRSHHQAG